jgi:hypothetical protein
MSTHQQPEPSSPAWTVVLPGPAGEPRRASTGLIALKMEDDASKANVHSLTLNEAPNLNLRLIAQAHCEEGRKPGGIPNEQASLGSC